LLPYSEIIGFRFESATDLEVRDWYTSSLVSASGGGFTIQPDELRPFDFLIRPCDLKPEPAEEDWDYRRWCIDLPRGSYQVWYQYRVDEDFYDPDSHWQLPDLQRQAQEENAVVWLGQILSNRLQLVRT
jgi:hypothetical protein